MNLPTGFLDDLRDRISLSQVVARKVVWDSKKSNPGKGDMWAPCPFHQEKTASFHVDDRKGFYYCFGCHAKGDAISFVKDTENVGFMEAVEILAREAGMPVPKASPQEQEKADKRNSLVEVMEEAVKFYRLQLHSARASEARAYLERRGMPDKTLERFEIGFAPDTRTLLFAHLTAKGIAPAQIIEAGLCIKPDDGGAPYDRFRGRIMFPIRDARGRCIAFGGRAMDPNARAKYLNSPETPLFDKGRSLYNHGPAREAAGKTGVLILAEGYMDVIALVQAGFTHAVAPLGTAITEHQLAMIWRMCGEPVIALDGDKAGINAAMRLIDLALPLLEAGKSLRFCILPEGLDPDDLIKAQGAAGMQKLVDSARPLVELLWRRETDGKVFDSPERRATLDNSLREALRKIKDDGLRRHYGEAMREMRSSLFYPPRPNQSGGFKAGFSKGKNRWHKGNDGPTTGTKSSLLAQENTEARVRESAILLGCLNHPDLAESFETRLERAKFTTPDLRIILNAIVAVLPEIISLTGTEAREKLVKKVADQTGFDPIQKCLAIGQTRINPYLQIGASKELSRHAIGEELEKLAATQGIAAEIRDAETEITGVADEGLTWRLKQARENVNRSVRDSLNGESLDEEADSALRQALQKLIDDQIWKKK